MDKQINRIPDGASEQGHLAFGNDEIAKTLSIPTKAELQALVDKISAGESLTKENQIMISNIFDGIDKHGSKILASYYGDAFGEFITQYLSGKTN